MPGQNRAGVLHPSAAFERRFEQIANLSRDISGGRKSQHNRRRHIHTRRKPPPEKQRTCHAGNGPLPGFLGTQVRRQRVFSDRAAYKIRSRVSDPGNHQRKEQNPRTRSPHPMQANRITQRQRDKQQSARTDSRPICETDRRLRCRLCEAAVASGRDARQAGRVMGGLRSHQQARRRCDPEEHRGLSHHVEARV